MPRANLSPAGLDRYVAIRNSTAGVTSDFHFVRLRREGDLLGGLPAVGSYCPIG